MQLLVVHTADHCTYCLHTCAKAFAILLKSIRNYNLMLNKTLSVKRSELIVSKKKNNSRIEPKHLRKTVMCVRPREKKKEKAKSVSEGGKRETLLAEKSTKKYHGATMFVWKCTMVIT